MGQILHGSARTTAALRRTIQHSQESIARLAERYDLNAKTVAKWRKRTSVEDAPMGPRQPHSTVLTAEQEATIVAFRQRTLLPLDDCLYALQASITNLTRSSLHRCLQRHGISRLPEIEGDRPKKKFANYAIGYFHVDIAEVHTEQGRLYLFVAIDRTSKFAYAELHPDQTRDTACRFLRRLIAGVPYRIHTILTDNGIQFTNRLKDKWAFKHLFDRVCIEHGIEHRLTKVNHPWTNGQVERMNRTIKDATVKRYHYDTQEQLKEHLAQFLAAYNFAKRLKMLRGLTPYEYISKCWQKESERFRLNPHHLSMGLNS
jgi:transposase InsO family protein